VHEHIFTAIITNDKAEAFLPVEEFYDAGTFANDLSRHAATTTAEAAATTGTATAAEAAATITETAAAEAATIAAETATITETAAKTTATLIWETAKIVAAETVPFVPAASAATSVKTHAL